MTKHRAPLQYPIVSANSIRRAMRRAMWFGMVIGAGLVGLGWFIFYLRECRT